MSKVSPLSADKRNESPARASKFPEAWKRLAIYLGAGVAIFLLGFVPMWLQARERAGERDSARRELHLSQMQNLLAAAALDARRGDYEPARQAASDFFTALRDQVDAGDKSALTQGKRERLQPLLTERDETITLLARSDPAAADRLAYLYAAYREAMRDAGRQGET